MEARPVDRLLRRKTFVEDRAEHADERGAQPRPAGRRRAPARGRRRRRRAWEPSCSPSGHPARSGSRTRSVSPSMLFRCRSSPGSQSPEPSPRLVVNTHAVPSASTTVRFVVWPSIVLPALERGEQRVGAAGRIETRERLREAGEAGARPHPAAGEVAVDRLRPGRGVRGEILDGHGRRDVPPSARRGLPRSTRCRPRSRPRRGRARAPGRARAAAARRPLRADGRRARTSRRLRASSSPARASRGTTRVPSASRRRCVRAAAPARRARPTAGVRARARARRGPPGRPGTAHDDAPIA